MTIMKYSLLLLTLILSVQQSAIGKNWNNSNSKAPKDYKNAIDYGEYVDYGNQLPEPSDFRRNGWKAPSDGTLKHYFNRQLHSEKERGGRYTVIGSDNPYIFEPELQENEYIKEQLATTGLVSYLFYEDGKIKVDEKSPENRFGDMFNDNSQLTSQSVGKSMVSYVLGHAICSGYIESVDEKMDWKLLKDTLYENQRLTDLINMRAGDQNHIKQFPEGLLKAYSRSYGNPNNRTIASIMNTELKDTKKSSATHNYNNLIPNMVLSYIVHKSDGNFQKLLNEVFQKKSKIEGDVLFLKQPFFQSKIEKYGLAKSTFYASRYDYLRIAKAMLDDWNNDTCVGQYLKTIYENREYKSSDVLKAKSNNSPNGSNHRYGGFFHTDYKGYWGSPNIVAMDGYGGQMIWINFDDNRVVVTNAIHSNFDWKEIVADTVKNGLKE